MCQLICGNVVAEMEGNKKRIVAMELSKIGGERERERERIVQIKKNILDSYSKKYTYSYSFRMSIVLFFIEAV